MLRVIAERLPQFQLDPGFLQGVPKELAGMLEPNATQNATIIDARLTMALGNEGLQPRHLRVGQPERLLIVQSPCGG